MAVVVTELVWSARIGLTPVEKLVLLRIADRVNSRSGVAWPSTRAIAADCGLTQQGTMNILDRLIAREILVVDREAVGRRSRRYKVRLEKLVCAQPGLALAGDEDEVIALNPVPRCAQPGTTLRSTPLSTTGEPDLEPEVLARAPDGRRVDFERFWAVYPKRQAKAAALEIWNQISPSPPLVNQMIAAVQRQARSDEWRESNGKFVPQPANWLKAQRWLDEVQQSRTSTAVSEYEHTQAELRRRRA